MTRLKVSIKIHRPVSTKHIKKHISAYAFGKPE